MAVLWVPGGGGGGAVGARQARALRAASCGGMLLCPLRLRLGG